MALSIRDAAALIRAGKLVAFPTETVYGLGANAFDSEAVRKIYELKGRPPASPLIVHVDSVEMARQCVSSWPAAADDLAAKFWPGPLTLVLPKSPQIPDITTAGLPTVAIRVPSHPVALELIRAAGVPIAAPSANRFTGLSPTSAEHVRAAFGDSVPVLEGGPSNVGIESTVISLTGDRPVMLRPGMIEIEGMETASKVREGAHPSPGLHERHYSPRTPLLLIPPDSPLPEGRLACMGWTHRGDRFLEMPRDEASYAAKLYAALHELDLGGFDCIVVEPPPDAWGAITDRLRRAAGLKPSGVGE